MAPAGGQCGNAAGGDSDTEWDKTRSFRHASLARSPSRRGSPTLLDLIN
jgi:hypothetical protein